MISLKKYRVKTGEKEREYSKKLITQMREDQQIPDTGEVFDKKKKEWIKVDTFLAQFEEKPKAKAEKKQTRGGKYEIPSFALTLLIAVGTGFLVFSELSKDKSNNSSKIAHGEKSISLLESIKDEHPVAHKETHENHETHEDSHGHGKAHEESSARDTHATVKSHNKSDEHVAEAMTLPEALKFEAGHKPSPDQIIEILKSGNKRFASGKSLHPNTNESRMRLAGRSNQANYTYATVLSCSDSTAPAELIFDAGIMDIFSIRVAGNICNTTEIGSIEYGLSHVQTPVLLIMGHSKCSAITTITHAKQGKGKRLERNIPALLSKLEAPVEKAVHEHPYVLGDSIIPYAVEENIWHAIHKLFMESPISRQLVRAGEVKIVGAIYDVGTGKVEFLEEEKTIEILVEVEKNKDKANNIYAKN